MKTTGITFSAFDLLHAGHIAMLKEAKEHCDYLIVGLQTDPSIERSCKNKPIQSLFERYVQLKGCKYVDEVIPYTKESEIYEILLTYPIDIRFVGEEYTNKNFTAKDLCLQKNIKIHYNKRQHNFSSSSLRHRIEHNNATIIPLKKEIQ
jgi:glycerol-3-phosphate cytidylyltransferase